MLYRYDKSGKAISQCKETEFKTQGLLERRDLSKWIEHNPEILGEDLLIVTTEYDGFDRTSDRLDLLALDKNGNLVVIELKRDDSGKSADLQALKYAAFCSTLRFSEVAEIYHQYLIKKGEKVTVQSSELALASFIQDDDFEEFNDRPRIILVAREFRPEVTASVLWLRKFELDIRCVKLDLYELSEDVIALNSSVLIPLPEAEEYLIRVERKELAEHKPTSAQAEYLRFFSKCIDSLKKYIPHDYKEPKPNHLYQIPTGIAGVHFEWWFRGRPMSRFGVELHFEKGNRESNQSMLAVCARHKESLDAALQESLVIEDDWGRTWTRLYVEKQQVKIDDDLGEWAVDKMRILIKTLQPELDKIKAG